MADVPCLFRQNMCFAPCTSSKISYEYWCIAIMGLPENISYMCIFLALYQAGQFYVAKTSVTLLRIIGLERARGPQKAREGGRRKVFHRRGRLIVSVLAVFFVGALAFSGKFAGVFFPGRVDTRRSVSYKCRQSIGRLVPARYISSVLCVFCKQQLALMTPLVAEEMYEYRYEFSTRCLFPTQQRSSWAYTNNRA